MNPIKLIKEGIIEEDWKKVKSAYQILTGDDDDIEPPVKNKREKTSSKISKKEGQKKKKKTIDPEIDRKGEKVIAKMKLDLRKNFLKSGKVDLSSVKMITPFDNAEMLDKEEMLENKRAAKSKIKASRPEYEPKMCKCTQCSALFDFHKAYPLGLFASGKDGSQNILCNQCQNNKR